MGALHRFEQRLEHMVTGAFARAFRSAVQPMEIAAALQREVDNSAQILSRDRRLAPNDFTIDLSGDRLRPAVGVRRDAGQRARRDAARARRTSSATCSPARSSSTSSAPTTSPPAGSGCAAPPPPQVTPAPGQRARPTPIRRAPVVFLEIGGDRHPLRARPAWSSAAAPTPTCASTTPASRAATSSSASRTASKEPTVSVVDLGSTNGTLVDGHRVQHAFLTDGSVDPDRRHRASSSGRPRRKPPAPTGPAAAAAQTHRSRRRPTPSRQHWSG